MSANSNKISRKYVASDNATHLGGWRRGLAREEASRRCLLEQLEDRRLLSDPKAELIGTMFEIQESSLTAGERFDVTFEITNVGDVNAHYYSDSIAYFHMWVGDDFWSNGTPLIDWDWSSGPGDIAPGESLGPITVQLNAPTVNEMENRGWGSGNYRIGMYIDGTGAVPEYNEQNNYNYSEGGDYQTIYVNAVDDEPPTAVLHAQDLGPEYYDQSSGHFDITYTDNVQVDIPYYHNVRVDGPNGFTTYAGTGYYNFDHKHQVMEAVDYTFAAPDYSWTPDDSGTYTVYLTADTNPDHNDNFAPEQAIGTFNVDIHAFTPVAELIDPEAGSEILTSELNDRGYFDVTYRDTGIFGLSVTSINDSEPEFTLTYDDGTEISCSTSGSWLDNDDWNWITYRYSLWEDVHAGDIHLNFPQGAFTDDKGGENDATVLTFTALPDPTEPLADLTYPLPDQAVDPAVLNQNKYLEVKYTATDPATVDGDEINLAGPGAENLSVSSVIEVADNVYHYLLSGDYGIGPVNVLFNAGSWANPDGETNDAKTESFTAQPVIDPLYTDPQSGTFTYNNATHRFEADGVISLGMKPDEGVDFLPLLTVEGTVGYDATHLYADGIIVPVVADISVPLFTGSFEIPLGESETSLLTEAVVQPPTALTIGGTDLQVAKMSLVTPPGALTSASRLEIQGKITLPEEVGGVSLDLQNAHRLIFGQSGMTLTGGELAFPDTDFSLLGLLDVEVESLSVEYIAATNPAPPATPTPDMLRIRGKVTLPDFYNVTADFSRNDLDGEDNYIQISSAGVDFVGSISAEDIVIVPDLWEINEAKLTLDTTVDKVYGNATVTIPPGMTLIGGLGFINGEFNYVELGLDNLNKPIGLTGAFLQKITGRVDHMAEADKEPITFGGDIGLTAGPEINISLPDWAGGDVEGSLVSLNLGGDLSKYRITGQGDMEMVGGLVSGEAVSELNWHKGFLSAATTITALDELITATGKLHADSDMNLTMSGTGTVKLPDVVPLWGGTELGTGNALLKFSNDDNYANDYIAGWGNTRIAKFGTTFNLTAGIKVNFDGSWQFLGAKRVAALKNGPVPPAPKGLSSATYQAEAGSPWLLMGAEWSNSAPDATVQVTMPGGTVLSEADINARDDMAFVDELTDADSVALVVRDPAAGNWTITVTNDGGLSDLQFTGMVPTPEPQVEFTNVTVDNANQQVTINYVASDSDSDALLGFYYESAEEGADGFAIAEGITETDSAGTITWNTTGLASGSYYLRAIIDDGENAPLTVQYDDPVNIINPAPVIGSFSADASRVDPGGNVTLTAENVTDSDGTVESVAFYRDANGDGTLQVNTDTLLGEDTDSSDGWTWSGSVAGWDDGDNILFAVGTDDTGGQGDAVSLTVRVAPPGIEVQVGGSNPSAVNYVDSDGTNTTVKIKGAVATFTFEGDSLAAEAGKKSIIISGSNITIASVVITDTTTGKITVKTVGGDGSVTIGDISVTGSLKMLTGKGVNLGGDLTLSGSLNKLQLAELQAGSSITIGGNPGSAPAKLTFTNVTDSGITSAAPIKALTVLSWQDTDATVDMITAPSINKLTAKGDFAASLNLTGAGGNTLNGVKITGNLSGTWTIAGNTGNINVNGAVSGLVINATGNIKGIKAAGNIAGNINALSLGKLDTRGSLLNSDITLTLPANPGNSKLRALGKVKIRGWADNSDIRTNANIGSVVVGGMNDSNIFAGTTAGLDSLPDSSNDFISNAAIASLVLKGVSGSQYDFINSDVAAAILGKVVVRNCLTDNSGTAFGIAGTSIKSFTRFEPGGKYRWSAKKEPAGPPVDGDFNVRLL